MILLTYYTYIYLTNDYGISDPVYLCNEKLTFVYVVWLVELKKYTSLGLSINDVMQEGGEGGS